MEQKEPTFVFWAKDEHVFRPAKIVKGNNRIVKDLEDYVEFLYPEIKPESLLLVNSTYLGPHRVELKRLKSTTEETYMDELRESNYQIAKDILSKGSDFAKKMNVPYFSMNIIESNPGIKSSTIFDYTLHPTVQLYVLRNGK